VEEEKLVAKNLSKHHPQQLIATRYSVLRGSINTLTSLKHAYVAIHVPELFSTLKVIGEFSLEDFTELSNTHALFTDAAPPNSCIMNDTPAGGVI
jgi:hypothetical protein